MGDELRKAVKFISLELQKNPGTDRVELIQSASQEYDLNPLQMEFLLDKFVFQDSNKINPQ